MDIPTILLLVLVGVTVAAAVMGVHMLMSTSGGNKQVEERLKNSLVTQSQRKAKESANLLKMPTFDSQSAFAKYLPNPEKMLVLYEQAHVNMEFSKFLMVPLGLAFVPVLIWGLGAARGMMLPLYTIPIGSGTLAMVPFAWLKFRKDSRIKQFTAALPEALELTGRALRAGHGLASGLHMVGEEMNGPIAEEFARVFEEQNLGIPMEEALNGLTMRMPTMDVKFFVTAVKIQRTAGGDLGEILDKIGRLVRERFEIRGQVAALTGEGRLSGMVLLSMPPGLLGYLYFTNPAYVMPLFTDKELGQTMLIGATVLQILGALAIKKIVNIKV